ncbi:MAG TPA: hypothetical protein VKA09_14775 [Nitrososphaeraceae archaeon]|nr:hypothetical protein [Nitrososphaeraceae archaeon]
MTSKIVQIAREQEEMLKKQTGIGQSLSEEDLKRSIENVLQEVKKLHRDNQL